ncbi:MAG TPA: hypothetical protein VFZ68_11425 [Acidimicrobiales bacterium]
MTVADVLDGGFAVISARPRRVLGFVAAFIVPVYLLAGFVQRDQLRAVGAADIWSSDPTVFRETGQSSSPLADLAGSLLGLVLPALVLVCVAAGLAHLVAGWTVGRDPSAREMAAVVGRRWWALLASFLLVHLAEGAGIVVGVIGGLLVAIPLAAVVPLAVGVGILFGVIGGWLVAITLFATVAPVIGTEGVGPLTALARAMRLGGARFWRTLGLVLLMGIVSWVLTSALSVVPQGLATVAGADGGWALQVVGGIVSQMVVLPFVAAATVLLYLDLRIRTEGLDIELRAVDLADRAG